MELNQSKKDMDWLTSVKFYNFFFNKYVQLIAEKKIANYVDRQFIHDLTIFSGI